VTIKYTIKWEKTVIQTFGDTNKGEVFAEIIPGIGSTVAWTTPPGKGQPGKIMAFGSTIFDIINLEGGLSGTLQWTVPKPFDLFSLPGTNDGNRGIKEIHAG
jgi:hypothetical protein